MRPVAADWREKGLALLLIAALSVFMHLPHLLGFVRFNLDFDVHIHWATETARMMAAGDPWPRWMSAGKDGLGEPVLLYYAPLYFLLSGLLRFLTGTTFLAMTLVNLFGTIACGWLSWLLVRAWSGPRAAVFAAGVAVLNPMQALLLYGFNGLAWATAFAPLTLLAWALLRPGADRQVLNVPAVIGVALTICMHTISGLMGLGCVAVFALSGVSRRSGLWRVDWRPLLCSAVTILGGVLLSAAYLLPAFASRSFINSELLREGYVPFNAFAFPVLTAWAFGIRWFAFQWPIALPAAVTAALLLLAARRVPAPLRTGLLWPGLIICAMSLFLATELSYPLWLPITPLRYVQFPHRFITVTTIFVPLLAVPVLAGLRRRDKLAWALAGALAAHVGLASAVVVKDGFMDAQRSPYAAADRLTLYTGLMEYDIAGAGREWPAYLARGGFAAECARTGVECAVMVRQGRAMTWRVDAAAATELALPVFAFPALEPSIDGRPVAWRRDAATGLIVIALPAGPALVAVGWRMLPSEIAGLALSALTAAALAGLSLQRRWRPSRAGRAVGGIGPPLE